MNTLPVELLYRVLYQTDVDSLINLCSLEEYFDVCTDRYFIENYFKIHYSFLSRNIFRLSSIQNVNDFVILNDALAHYTLQQSEPCHEIIYDDYETMGVYRLFMLHKLVKYLSNKGYIDDSQAQYMLSNFTPDAANIIGIFSLKPTLAVKYLDTYFLPLKFSVDNLTLDLMRLLKIPIYVEYGDKYLRDINVEMFNYVPVNFRDVILWMVSQGLDKNKATERLLDFYPLLVKYFSIAVDYGHHSDIKDATLKRLTEWFELNSDKGLN